ncbi:MAG TPA: helix-turn-helix domain-containing protein [Mycobacteriales bacterium]|jgi:AraC-like DNA-binding protein|nr:helix-turn-helix domain-containing protein [Mycobacteriales bacterium]
MAAPLESRVESRYVERPFGDDWDHLDSRWTQHISGSGTHRQLVLPDGASDILVDHTGAAFLVGPTADVDIVEIPAGEGFRSLRLRPGALRSAVGVPATEVRGKVLPLADVVGAATARKLTRITLGGPDDARSLQRGWLESPPDRRVRGAIAWLRRYGGRDVSELAEITGLSPRQLRRLLLEHAGLGPKALQRVFRLQRFLALAEQPGTDLGLAEVAVVAGYADQAHLTREVRSLAGLTPTALLRHRSA